MKFTLTKKAASPQVATAGGSVAGPAASGTVAAIAMPASRKRSKVAKSAPDETPQDARVTKAGKPTRPAKQPRTDLRIGAEPRVDLLPLEVRAERHGAVKVRRAWFGVVGVVALVAIAAGGASLYATHAKTDLTNAQAQTSALSVEQQKYVAVRTAQDKVSLYKAAQSVGGSTDVDWSSYLDKIQAALPAGVTLTNISITSASPLDAFAQASSPLQGVRSATVTFTATSLTLPYVPTWLDSLQSLPGYVDASAGSVAAADSSGAGAGGFTVDLTLHLNSGIFSNLYKTKGK